MEHRLKSLASDIFEAVSRNRQDNRKYLGMSTAGHPCDRNIWYGFHKFTPVQIDGRALLIFEMGDHVEQIVTRWLRGAGFLLENAYPDRQLSFEHFGGFLRGHCDGIINIDGTRAILECKSAKDAKFKAFALAGIRKTNPTYFAQTQFYMGFAGLQHALFVVMNKDNCEIYNELVTYDPQFFAQALQRVEGIIRSSDAPEKAFEKDSLECKWCDFRIHCWNHAEAIQSFQGCMSCHYLRFSSDWNPSCWNEAHKVELKDPWLSCPDYRWIGRTPF